MRSLLLACALVLAAIIVFGFIRGDRPDRVRITTLEEKHTLHVVVTLYDISEPYRWVGLHVCTADRAEDMRAYCNDLWESESTHPTRIDQQQYPFPLRNVPGGLLLITAYVFDIDDRVLAHTSLAMHKSY